LLTFSSFCSVKEVLVILGQKWVGITHDLNMIPDGHIPNTKQSVNESTVFGYALDGKMIVMEVTMKNPPTPV
jgi:hypothetical protein